MGDHDVCAALADTAAMQEDEAALRRYAPMAEELALRYAHALYEAVAHRAWGVAHRLAGECDESTARLSQALAIFQGLGTRWQLGRTLYELGRLAALQMDRDTAHACFTGALAHFEAMRTVPDSVRTQAALAALSYPEKRFESPTRRR